MLFDLFLIAKVSIIFIYPNKFLLFIGNLCFCSLKIAVRALKITIISKNCRLKITIESKNCRLKILVRVYARMYARVYYSGQIVIRTQDHNWHTNGTHDHQKREGTSNAGKPEYICMISGNEKKYKKN